MEQMLLPEHMVFGLDIGTRSVVGSVGYLERDKFKVVAHCVREHDTRAMMDGQIHDIQKVGATICYVKNQLEKQLNRELKEVCIAAAGRVLKTVTVHVDVEYEQEETIDSEKIYSLELAGIEKAYSEICTDDEEDNYFCVGYTVVRYYLNNYVMGNLDGHKGKTISADVLATFLPSEVVEGLYSAVRVAGLEVSNLTLEPIAAINVAIPEQYRLLNIALVDVGAGTSDICITKDGSIIAYGMIPHAGDEITEKLVEKYLVDFKTAEKIKLDSTKKRQISFKDIMGLSVKVPVDDVRDTYKPTVEFITEEIASKIKELNGGKPVSAVFVVGGGGKAYGFTQNLAANLELPETRVALRGEEVLGNVDFLQEKVKKDPLLVTPIGICINYYEQKNNFIFVSVNGERIKLYDNNKLTVVDAAMQVGFPNDALFPRRGKELQFTVDGKQRTIRGQAGEPAEITINGKKANMLSAIGKNDIITIKESTSGETASCNLDKLPEYKGEIVFEINKKKMVCPKFTHVNGELKPGSYEIQENDEIVFLDYYTVEQLMRFIDIDMSDKAVYVNNRLADSEDKVYENFSVVWKMQEYNDLKEETVSNDITEDKQADAQASEGERTGEVTENQTKENVAQENVAQDRSEQSTMLQGTLQKTEANSTPEQPTQSGMHAIKIIVNGSKVQLKSKEKHCVVDILDVYPFDVQQAAGRQLVLTKNGEDANFSDSLQENDIVELGWKEN